MEKTIRELKSGETFLDTFGVALTVERIEPLPWLAVPGTSPKMRVWFITSLGNRMYQNFPADRKIKVV